MRIFYRTILFAAIVMVISSCKKGDNDPFLSLYSRTARLAGEWEIQSYEYNERTTNTDGDYTDITETYDNGIITRITQYYIHVSESIVYDTTIVVVDHVKYLFSKDNTWSSEYYTTEYWSDQQEIGGGSVEYDTLITTAQRSENGDWSFLGGVDGEYKNKERLVMNVLSREKVQQITSIHTEISSGDVISSTNYGDQTTDLSNFYSGEQSTILEIDQLKRKEIILIEKRRNTGSVTITPYQGISTTSADDEFYSDSKLTLKRI